MENKEKPIPKIRSRHVHRLLKALSPKRESKKGELCRSITPEAIQVCTEEINDHMRRIVINCELSLRELNNNPNSYYQQHRYNSQVMKMAIERLNGKDST